MRVNKSWHNCYLHGDKPRLYSRPLRNLVKELMKSGEKYVNTNESILRDLKRVLDLFQCNSRERACIDIALLVRVHGEWRGGVGCGKGVFCRNGVERGHRISS